MLSCDITFPFNHVNSNDTVTVEFSSLSGVPIGAFLVSYIQFDSNAGVSGEWVEQSGVQVTGENGNGSVNTRVFRYDTIEFNNANGFEYISSATEGDYFLITESGWFDTGFSNRTSAATQFDFGIVRLAEGDTTVLNATMATYPSSKVLAITTRNGSANVSESLSWSGYLNKGDRIFSIGDDASNSGLNQARFYMTRTANHQGVVKEGNPYDANETWLNVNSDESINGARFGVNASTGDTNDGISVVGWTSGAAHSSSGWELDISSLGLTAKPAISAIATDSTIVQGRDETTYCPAPYDTLYVALGDGIVYRKASFSLTIKKNYPDADNSKSLLILNHVTRLNGQEYPVMGEYVELADGTRYQVFERAFDGTSGTKITGLPSTLKPVDNVWAKFVSNDSYVNIVGTNVNFVEIYYYYGGVAEGNIAIGYGGTYTSDADTVYTFRYYDTARPL